MTSWMSESADERERASDQSLAACLSLPLKDAERTLASCLVVASLRGNLWQGPACRVKYIHILKLDHSVKGPVQEISKGFIGMKWKKNTEVCF